LSNRVFTVLVVPNALGSSILAAHLPARSFDEMMRNFELQRDKEFALHVCGDHPRTKRARE
jgi:hypothetical protein